MKWVNEHISYTKISNFKPWQKNNLIKYNDVNNSVCLKKIPTHVSI